MQPYTKAERLTADKVQMPIAEVRWVIDTYMEFLAETSRERAEKRRVGGR